MTEPDQPPSAASGARDAREVRPSRAQRRRQKMAAEIARNRQGGHTVPTWALALLLVLIVGGWLLLVFTA
jgi:hypothetical protein